MLRAATFSRCSARPVLYATPRPSGNPRLMTQTRNGDSLIRARLTAEIVPLNPPPMMAIVYIERTVGLWFLVLGWLLDILTPSRHHYFVFKKSQVLADTFASTVVEESVLLA